MIGIQSEQMDSEMDRSGITRHKTRYVYSALRLAGWQSLIDSFGIYFFFIIS